MRGYSAICSKRNRLLCEDSEPKMNRLLVLAVVFTIISAAASVKEWKNFENGKVYSHKMPIEKDVESHTAQQEPKVEERLLHSHRRDKKLKNNPVQAAEGKTTRGKNPERHHKKSVEEEMHLRPLNERHHKFLNPALLDKIDYSNPPSPQISRQKLVKQAKHGRTNNRRRQRGRREKRNKSDQKVLVLLDNNSEINAADQNLNSKTEHASKNTKKFENIKDTKILVTKKPQIVKEGFPSKISSYW